ncbi:MULTISPECIES: hypothetical protein [Anoxynatronum]|uniref:Uncharacterized protein n=1 Tax=Anoxynatronum sibiricum TaxID=210623 RepID=A0ABU9VR90_9CLOT|nr:hypothetical protein [Anoxynatronum buryatiense]
MRMTHWRRCGCLAGKTIFMAGVLLLLLLMMSCMTGCGIEKEVEPAEEVTRETAAEQQVSEAVEEIHVPDELEAPDEAVESSDPKDFHEAGKAVDETDKIEATNSHSDDNESEGSKIIVSSEDYEPVEASEKEFREMTPRVQAEPGALIITGDGLENELVLNPSEWQLNHPWWTERYYSSNNNLGFHKIWLVKGYDLGSLLKEAGLKTDEDYLITFESADGVIYSEKWSSLQNRYYFSDLTTDTGQLIGPLIGFYRKEVFDAIEPQPPVHWQTQELTASDRDPQWPRLYMGQQQDHPSDINQPMFLRELVRIVVGQERKE